MTEIAVTRAGAERIDDVEPLWHAMHRLHRSVAGHLTAVAPFRSDDESWVRRRAFYERLLARPDSFLLLAELAIMEGNDDAARFYQRRGPRPIPQADDRPGAAGSLTARCSRAS